MRSRWPILLALAALSTSDIARADTPPNAWDMAKDPLARDRFRLHITVRELLAMRTFAEVGRLRTLSFEQARALLEDTDAAHSPDVRLRFDLGEVYEFLELHQQAIDVLKSALATAPDHSAAEEAYLELAYAYAKLDRSLEERAAYEQFLARTLDEVQRATAVLNLAEADMRLGRMDDAITGYRDAIQLSAALPPSRTGPETGILAVWGLAVALDRSGDGGGAIEQAKLAIQMDPDDRVIGDTRNVFFVPDYERLWYLGLGAIERAKQAKDARAALVLWSRANKFWSVYVERTDAQDRWLPLARAHRERSRSEKARAAQRSGSEPVKQHDDAESGVF